ncbi:transcriptional regulator [Cupriavidus sp. amp6]|uniref:transcriptional regulator n=1 Tax=Cupriavidus sp. amp6 TaxID=388051 RepID=UPI0004144769|nr:transcriptional regulator [Cupriavidus sp. amp6]
MKTIHSARYAAVITELRRERQALQITQQALAERLSRPQSYVAKVELLERRLDVVEVGEWLLALGQRPTAFFQRFDWWS